ncbi:hypothetical protein FQK07_11860 [Synechococcus sp. BSF8S]|uniref:hypothetical protein n=2 Tax=Cyanophyceae TaxID=3028117 RepID=UPI001624C957|nr:hypothetical protein [Synechococcus sp. BSF8S]MBC1261947.1 hypothetical protein [Synechococcus sp. BSF8S]
MQSNQPIPSPSPDPGAAAPLTARTIKPMATTITSSNTVIGSLCREVDVIRHRCSHILDAMSRCQNSSLYCRLSKELRRLHGRRLELLETARTWKRRGVQDPLSIAFLIEISSRPLPS